MLKNLVPLFFLLFSLTAFSQYISVTNVSPNPVCAGNDVDVIFSATNGKGIGNQYSANTDYQIYLSNISGSAYTNIGLPFQASNEPYETCGGCTTSGLKTTITIPRDYLAGSNYKITIGEPSNNPIFISGTVPSNPFSIETPPVAPTVSVVAETCSSAAVVTVTNYNSNLTYTSLPAGLTIAAGGLVTDGTTGTSYTITAINAATCTATSVSFIYDGDAKLAPAAPVVTVAAATCSSAAVVTVTNVVSSGITYTSSPTGLSVNTTTGVVTGGTNGTPYTLTATNANTCTATSLSFTYDGDAQPSNNVWNGSADINWNNAANWCTGVPSVTNNLAVLIPSSLTTSYSPTLSTGDFGYVEDILFESGSILTVDDNYLFVKTNLTLNGNSKIDLNNEAQLVQGADALSTFSGTGTIEIDQQGTSDSFKYNYWGSPVNKTGTTYTIAGVLRDGTNRTTINEFNLINFSTPYAYADGNASVSPASILLSTYWMYKYANLGIGYNGWTRVGSGGSLNVGEGFTMKGSNTDLTEQNYTFVGQPNNGDITLTIDANNDYLIGNPYPSAIDAKQFIRDNINVDVNVLNTVEGGNEGNRTKNIIDGNLYFWDHFGGGNHLLKSYEGGYAIYNLSGGVQAISNDVITKNTGAKSLKVVAQRYIPVAQGFFVSSLEGGGVEKIQFKNSQRIFKKEDGIVSQFMKSTKTSKAAKETDEDIFPRFHLNYSSPKGYHRQILVAFIENTTDGVDIGYDAINYENFAEDFSWKSNDVKLVIQAVPTLNDKRILPIEVKVAITGMIKINIDNAENIPEDTEIFIKDKITGKMHNISKTPFEIELTAGKYADRFAITFKMQKLVAEDVKAEILIPATSQPIIEGIHVFMNNPIKELQIKNNSSEEIKSVALINSLGQTVQTWNSNFKIRTISLPINTATGVYLVQIISKTGKTIKKISVE